MRRALAPLQADGLAARVCRPGKNEGTSTRWRSRRPAWGSRSRAKRGRTTIAISLACANRRRGCRDGVGGGAGGARCRWSAWFAHMACRDLSRTCLSCRSISWSRCCGAASAGSVGPPANLTGTDYSAGEASRVRRLHRQPRSRNVRTQCPQYRAWQDATPPAARYTSGSQSRSKGGPTAAARIATQSVGTAHSLRRCKSAAGLGSRV